MKLSNQAMGTLMMTLQKCLLDQSDITGLLNQLEFDVQNQELVVLNPPMIRIPNKEAKKTGV
jgi:hypothetical protein